MDGTAILVLLAVGSLVVGIVVYRLMRRSSTSTGIGTRPRDGGGTRPY